MMAWHHCQAQYSPLLLCSILKLDVYFDSQFKVNTWSGSDVYSLHDPESRSWRMYWLPTTWSHNCPHLWSHFHCGLCKERCPRSLAHLTSPPSLLCILAMLICWWMIPCWTLIDDTTLMLLLIQLFRSLTPGLVSPSTFMSVCVSSCTSFKTFREYGDSLGDV